MMGTGKNSGSNGTLRKGQERKQIRIRIIADDLQLRALLRELVNQGSSVEVALECAQEKIATLSPKRVPGSQRRSGHYIRRLPVSRSGGRVRYFMTEEIDWIEAASQYVRLHVGQKSYLVRKSMAHLELRLDPCQFQRIHRSTIINVDRIREIHSDSTAHRWAVFSDGRRLQVSRVHWERLQAVLMGLS